MTEKNWPQYEKEKPDQDQERIQKIELGKKWEEKRKEIMEIFRKKYSASERIIKDIIIKLKFERLEEIFGDLENLKDKRILDLGCGSRPRIDLSKWAKLVESNPSEHNDSGKYYQRMGSLVTNMDLVIGQRDFEPWLCRILVELGAKPVGVDIGNLEGEEFEHYQLDLNIEGALNIFPDKSFDAINMRLLLSSPTFGTPSNEIIKELEKQRDRLLKDDGKIIEFDMSQ